MRTLICHLGLGDAIIMSRAAVVLSQDEHLVFPCWKRNAANIRSFFSTHPNIVVSAIGWEDELKTFKNPIHTGYYSSDLKPNGIHFDRWFYRQLGLEHEFQVSGPIPSAPLLTEELPTELPDDPYAFVADDTGRGFTVSKELSSITPIARPDPDKMLLSHKALIMYAAEIHVVSTCWLPFVNQLQPPCPKFFHRYARSPKPEDNPTVWGDGWTIID